MSSSKQKQQTTNSTSNSSSSPIITFLFALIKLTYYILSKLPYWVWMGIAIYLYYQYTQFNDPKNKKIRRQNRLPKPIASTTQPSSNQNTPRQLFQSSSPKPSRLYRPQISSPQTSRRSSSVYAPRTLPLRSLNRSNSYSNLSLDSPNRPMMRGSYSSQRIQSLAKPNSPGVFNSNSNSRFSSINLDEGNQYRNQSQTSSPKPVLISPYDLPPLFPPLQQQLQAQYSTSTSSYPTSNLPFSNSNLGRKRSLSKRIEPPTTGNYSDNDYDNNDDNDDDDDDDDFSRREGKRLKEGNEFEEEEEGESDTEMDVDRFELGTSRRGTKRGVSIDEDEEEEERLERRKSRRVLSEEEGEEEVEEEEESQFDSEDENDQEPSIIISSQNASNRKRRSPPSPNLEKIDLELKRSKSGTRGKPGSKRIIENVEVESASDDEENNVRETRNADSEGEEEEEEEEEKVEEKKDSRGASIKKTKSSNRPDKESDEDLMEGAFSAHLPPSPSPPLPTSGRKRTLTSKPKKKTQSSLGSAVRRTPLKEGSTSNRTSSKQERTRGEEWVNLEGDRYKIDEKGIQRRCCEVREIRKKYKMPKDSQHPDRNLTHEVVVEKWLTDSEFEAALKSKKLAWQTQDSTVDVASGTTSDTEIDDASVDFDTSARESGIYYTPGTGTPLRTHSSLGSTFASSSSGGGANKSSRSTPLSTNPLTISSTSNSPNVDGISPSYKNYINGRLRLPSGTPSNSNKNRAWSEMKSKLVVEDEEKKELEREKRRAASVRLGGEQVEVFVDSKGKGKETVKVEEEKVVAGVAPEKSLFGIAPTTTASTSVNIESTAPKVLPAFNLKPIPSSTPSISVLPNVSTSISTPVVSPNASAPLRFTPPAVLISKVPDFFSKPLATTTTKSPSTVPSMFGSVGVSATLPSFIPPPPAVITSPAAVNTFSFASAPTVAKNSELPISAPPSNSFSFAPATTAPVEPLKISTATTGVPSAASAPTPFAPPPPPPVAVSSFSFGPSTTAPSVTPSLPPPIVTSGFSFGSASVANPVVSTAQPFSFGTKSTTPLPTPTLSSYTSTTSLFGAAPTTTSTTALFGAAPATTSTTSSFGAVPATTSAFSFGNPAPTTTPQSVFGQATPTPAAPFSFSNSASNPSVTPATTGFSFGAPAAPPSFSFGAPATPAAPAFGFGSTNSPFGTTAPAFGSATPPIAPASGGFNFGAPSAYMGTGMFGGGGGGGGGGTTNMFGNPDGGMGGTGSGDERRIVRGKPVRKR